MFDNKTDKRERKGSMACLTQETIEEILLRLPIKSLIRFKCVCKQWFSLITDPKFAKLHLNEAIGKGNYFNNKKLLISIYTDNGAIDIASPSVHGQVVSYYNGMVCMDYEFNTSVYTMVSRNVVVDSFCSFGRKVVGSCNGLICVVHGFNTFYLWNPSTREEKTLPGPIVVHVGRVFQGLLLYGFGYDYSTDDYKMFRGCFSQTKHTTEIFSLKTNSWRKIHEEYPAYYPSESSGVFVNTALHWAVEKLYDGNRVDRGNILVSFDLKEEKYMEVPLPDELRNGSCPTIGVLGGDLSMIKHDSDDGHQVWRMKEYGIKDSWTKLINIRHSTVRSIVPFDCTKDGDIVVLLNTKELAIYNSRGEALENTILVVPQSNYWYRVALYKETLISPNNNYS